MKPSSWIFLALSLGIPSQSYATSNCGDAVDKEGDGWVDKADPDCSNPDSAGNYAERGLDTSYACNDGKDNDNDREIDAQDLDCDSGFGTSEASAPGCGYKVDFTGRGLGFSYGLLGLPVLGLRLRSRRKRSV